MSSRRRGGSSDRGEVGGGRRKFENERKDLSGRDRKETGSHAGGGTSPTPKDPGLPKCYRCGQGGHRKAGCPEVQCYRCYGWGHRAHDCQGTAGSTADEKLAGLKRQLARLEARKQTSVATLARVAEREKREEEQKRGEEAELQKARERAEAAELEAGIRRSERERRQAEKKLREENDRLILIERERLRQAVLECERLDRKVMQLGNREEEEDLAEVDKQRVVVQGVDPLEEDREGVNGRGDGKEGEIGRRVMAMENVAGTSARSVKDMVIDVAGEKRKVTVKKVAGGVLKRPAESEKKVTAKKRRKVRAMKVGVNAVMLMPCEVYTADCECIVIPLDQMTDLRKRWHQDHAAGRSSRSSGSSSSSSGSSSSSSSGSSSEDGGDSSREDVTKKSAGKDAGNEQK